MRHSISLLIAAGVMLSGCAEEKADGRKATASITGKDPEMDISGSATFVEGDDGLKITLNVSNAPPGEHGVHVHENGSCADNDAGAAGAAGGHFNPDMKMHGGPGAQSHAGDLGNMTVQSDGRGQLTITTRSLTLNAGASNVVGKAIVVHAMRDDEMTQPSGASGSRIGCGVIQ